MRYAGVAIGMIALLTIIHFCSLEGLQGLLFSSLAANEDTIFAPSYSDAAFRAIRRGMSEAEVLSCLHAPLGEVWFYENRGSQAVVGFSGDRVDHVSLQDKPSSVHIAVGMSKNEVERLLSSPEEKTFVYSRSRRDNSYHVRAILFRKGRVVKRISEFYVD